MKVFGVIVGIDRYDQPNWDTAGPCRNAIAAARWLRTITHPKNITLFLDSAGDFKAEISELRKAGADVRESATSPEIDTFCFGPLNKKRADSRLFFFWSGHGYVSNEGHRIFIARDYTDQQFRNRVFNASLFLRHLRSPEFSCFKETLLIADVCGTHADVRIKDPRDGPDDVGDAEQLAVFATPEGKYAHGEDGKGVFTDAALTALGEVSKWPDLAKLAGVLDARLEAAGQKPFRASISRGEAAPDKVYGKVSGSKLVRDIFAMLESESVSPNTYRFHYGKTVNRLKNPALHRAQGLSGMIGELASLQDSAGTGVTYGLLDFLLRLTQVEELEAKIRTWINDNAGAQASTVRGLLDDLKAENQARILLVELEHNPHGDIAAFEPYLRNQNMAPVADSGLARSEVANWNDFERRLSELIDSLGNISQIHFLADPPLFDRPFHAIPSPGGSVLGEEFVVVLRHRERHFHPKPQFSSCWKEYADALLQCATHKIKVIPAPASAAVLVGDKRGICYFTSPLPATTEGGASSLAEKQTLLHLLRLGVPYLCWLHRTGDGDWTPLRKLLTGCIKKSKTLEAFPESFLSERINSKEFGINAVLLWDDPGQKLFR